MDDETSISSKQEDTLEDHRRGGNGESGSLMLSEQEGYVGDTIAFRGRNCSPEVDFEIRWHSNQGKWGMLESNEVVGPQYQPQVETIAEVTTDEDGEFDHEWEISQDYGGDHLVELLTADGVPVDRQQFHVRPWFEIDRTEAPLGETFTITGYGIGPKFVTNNYQVAWDNGYVGFMTGVMNSGTATAEIRAVGSPGEHVLEVWRNHRGVPYLQNNTQSPYGPVGGDRQSRWTVEVTAAETDPETAWVDPLFDESPISSHYPEIEGGTDAKLEISPQSGQAGTTAFITGSNFPPREKVDLIWYRHEGDRVKGAQITPEPHPEVLPNATTDENGRFQVEVDIPPEQGSTRPITAAVDGREVAITGFMMQPDVERFEPRAGPVGTSMEIDLSGIGWTSYENAVYVVYDNKALGYAVGTTADDEQGVVRIEIPATGDPGWHFIDIYPALFEMQEDEPHFELRPHLSYLDNHPMRPLPGMHLAFEITDE